MLLKKTFINCPYIIFNLWSQRKKPKYRQCKAKKCKHIEILKRKVKIDKSKDNIREDWNKDINKKTKQR